MSRRRTVTWFVLQAVAVWLATFYLWTFTTRIYGFQGNKFAYLLRHKLYQAVRCDEELILFTCLTLWSVSWAWVITTFRSHPEEARLPFLMAVGTLLAMILGGGYLRHFFHGWAEDVFHVVYSVAVTAAFAAAVVWYRRGN